MLVSQEEVDKLPLIELKEFEIRFEKLANEHWLIGKLYKELGSWENFAPHLRRQLFEKIGARPIINKY